MAQDAGLASVNSLGDLVPALHPPNGNGHAGGSPLATLLDSLHGKSNASAYEHWQSLDQQPHRPEHAHGQLSASAHTCVLQMPDKTVGVLKVAADGGCTLFVRLNRPHASQMADRDEVPRDKARAFCRGLSVTEAFKVLSGAKPYCLKAGEVHHPHALSLLCSMTRRGILAPETSTFPLAVSSFHLVALTPLTRNFEQCLVLMGWKAAYTTHGDALWTAQAVDRSVWGATHGDMFVGDVASKFADAARELLECADPAVFTRHIPGLNESSGAGSQALGAVQTFLGTTKAFSTALSAPVPTPAAAAADESSEVDMAPSDEEGGALFVVPAAATTWRQLEASATRDNDDSDTQDQDEERVAKQDADLAQVVTTDSESDSEDAAEDHYFDDDDDDDDDDDKGNGPDSSSDEEEENCQGTDSDSDSEPLANKPIAKNNVHTPTARGVHVQGKEAAVPGARRLSEAEWLVEFARPCCKRMEHFKREHRALIAPERMALIDADLQELQTPKSVPSLLGAALSLVGNMAASHDDAPPEDAVPLGAVGRKRVRELALKAADFSELTFERVTGAIEAGQAMIGQLEDLRKRGRTLLESVESACANGHTSAPAQAPQRA